MSKHKNGRPSPLPSATPADLAAEVTPEVSATSTPEPEVKVKKSKRLTEESLRARFPGVVPGSLHFETEGTHKGKQTMESLLECGHTVRLATSDLFQVTACEDCRKDVLRERRKAKRHEKAEARKAAKATQAADALAAA